MIDNPEIPVQNPNPKPEKIGIPLFIQLIISTIFIITFIHAAKTRTLSDFIFPTIYIVGILSLLLFIRYFGRIFKSGIHKEPKLLILITIVVILFVVPISGIVYYSVFVSLKDLFLWILSPSLTNNITIILTLTFITIAGFALFFIRLHYRAIYGFTEAIIGLTVAATRILPQREQITSPNFYLVMLTASVYIVVRGLDNIHQGITKAPIDPLGSKIYDFLKKRV